MATFRTRMISESPSGQFTKTESTAAERIVLMTASALFKGLSPKECKEIASCAHMRTYAQDEFLFMQGQPVNNLVFIQKGSVKQTQLSPNGNEVIMWMNGSGDAMGVHSNSRSCSHTCSARAMEQCQAMVWEYTRLQALVNQYPQLRVNMSAILAGRLHELEERFHEIATEKVAKRLSLTLLRLSRQVGKVTPRGTEINLSRVELAQLTGATLFTISRILSRWAEAGFVVPRREAVVITDADALEFAEEGSE